MVRILFNASGNARILMQDLLFLLGVVFMEWDNNRSWICPWANFLKVKLLVQWSFYKQDPDLKGSLDFIRKHHSTVSRAFAEPRNSNINCVFVTCAKLIIDVTITGVVWVSLLSEKELYF